MTNPTDVVRDIFTAINAHDLDRFLAFVSTDLVDHEEKLPELLGPSDKDFVGQWLDLMVDAFPDMTMTVEDTIAAGDKVVSRVRLRGTHLDTIMGFAATGRAVDIQIIDIMRIADGLLAEHWRLSEDLKLLQQLGLFEPA